MADATILGGSFLRRKGKGLGGTFVVDFLKTQQHDFKLIPARPVPEHVLLSHYFYTQFTNSCLGNTKQLRELLCR